jgi:hypothetical protein
MNEELLKSVQNELHLIEWLVAHRISLPEAAYIAVDVKTTHSISRSLLKYFVNVENKKEGTYSV